MTRKIRPIDNDRFLNYYIHINIFIFLENGLYILVTEAVTTPFCFKMHNRLSTAGFKPLFLLNGFLPHHSLLLFSQLIFFLFFPHLIFHKISLPLLPSLSLSPPTNLSLSIKKMVIKNADFKLRSVSIGFRISTSIRVLTQKI